MAKHWLLAGLFFCTAAVWAADGNAPVAPMENSGFRFREDGAIRVSAELQGAGNGQTLAGVIRFSQEGLMIPERGAEVLDEVAARLKSDRHLDVVLIGHADLIGSREYSVALSDRRVAAVEAGLVQRGVRKSQIRRSISGHTDADACLVGECRQAAFKVEMHLVN